MLHLPYPFPVATRNMEYKPLPENSTTEKSESSNTMQPPDTVDIEKNAEISSSGYGTIPPYTNKEGVLRAHRTRWPRCLDQFLCRAWWLLGCSLLWR
ncbi:hypothetical protein H4I96_07201 [Botrytis cinerea]